MNAVNRTSVARECLFLAAAFVLAAGAAEAYLRAFAPQQLMSPAYDDRFGMRGFKPNARIKHQTQDYSVVYTTNDLGFRGKTYPAAKAPGTYRIEVFGPSAVFGSGVEDDEVFSAVLERRLRAAFPKRGIDVINLGLMGVSLSLDEYLYRTVGRRYAPDLVVLNLLYGNKESLNYQEAKHWEEVPVSRTSGLKALLRRFIRAFPGYAWLCENSNLYGLRRLALVDAVDVKAVDARDARPDPDAARKFEDLQRTFLSTFREFERGACGDGARFLLLANRVSLELFPLIDAEISKEARTSSCLTYRELDLGPEDTFPNDRHWTARGHARVADVLFDDVRGRLKAGAR
ncbi:MAG: hypothetical protein ACHQ49_01425 [Elusimicrobiota bacterium]